jgi:O-antigen ligase
LGVTALAVPLLYSTATLDPVLLLRFLVVSALGLGLASLFLVRAVRTHVTLSLGRREAIVFAILAAHGLTAAFSIARTGITPDGIFDLLKIVLLAWLIFASTRALQDPNGDGLLFLGKCAIASLCLVGGFAILQYYQIAVFEWMLYDTTVDSTMAHRNLLASFVLLALPFVMYAFVAGGGPWRLAGALGVAIAGFLLVALQTRSAWVAFTGGLTVSVIAFGVATYRARPRSDSDAPWRRRFLQAAAVAIVASCVALVFPSPAARAPMREHAGSLVQLENASIRERLQLWSRTLHMIGDHPFTGVGLGNWRIVIPAYGTSGLRSETGTLHFQRPHNDVLWVTSETGLLGGALYLALFVTLFVLAVIAVMRASTTRQRLASALILLGLSGYWLDSLFSFPRERVTHGIYLALLIGALLAMHPASPSRRQTLGSDCHDARRSRSRCSLG